MHLDVFRICHSDAPMLQGDPLADGGPIRRLARAPDAYTLSGFLLDEVTLNNEINDFERGTARNVRVNFTISFTKLL